MACCALSTQPPQAQRPAFRPGAAPRPRAVRPHSPADARSRRARPSTARPTPDTPAFRRGWPHFGATPGRSSTGSDPACGRSLAHRDPQREAPRSPLARRTTDTGPTTGQAQQWPSRHPAGTSGSPPPGTPPQPQPPPRSTPPWRSHPKTPARPPAATTACPATSSPTDPSTPASTPPACPSRTPIIEVSRRPIESAQFTSWAFTQRAVDSGLLPSMGSIGDCFDCEHDGVRCSAGV